MPSTHTSLHHHVIFSTKNRVPSIATSWRQRLHEYIGGCLRSLGAKPLQVGGLEDHVHLLVGLRATHALAGVVREVKKGSTGWIRENFHPAFQWQEGYGAFTLSRREVPNVDAYIRGQEEHHRTMSFQEEYLKVLAEHEVEVDPRYVW